MSTTATVKIYDEEGRCFCQLYVHGDGYLDYLGNRLVEFIGGKRWVNGIPVNEEDKVFNGMGDLAVQVVHHLKSSSPSAAGWLYIIHPEEEFDFIDYEYFIRFEEGKIVIDVEGPSKFRLFPKEGADVQS